jgi:hypothetical protein
VKKVLGDRSTQKDIDNECESSRTQAVITAAAEKAQPSTEAGGKYGAEREACDSDLTVPQ